MNALLLSAMWIGALASAQVTDGRSAQTVVRFPEPCYVVIAVDVSGSMESRDGPAPGFGGRGLTHRDEGQLVFLQLLPFLQGDLYLGVAHFSDRVRYSLPSQDTGPLLPWGQTFLSESACRNLVKPTEFQGSFRSDVAEGMSWASDRIQLARRQYGQGPGKLIILTNGDVRDSARELERGRGPLLEAAKRLAEQRIAVYPILIDEASFRSPGGASPSSGRELAAEDLLRTVALQTRGKVYRLTQELGFADVLMDLFGLAQQRPSDLVVSPHDWAIVTVGAPPKSITVGSGGAGPRTLAVGSSLEAASGIRTNVVSSSEGLTTILRRPETPDLVDRFWQGRWRLTSAQEDSPSAVRLYRIPAFLVQMEMAPGLPWWRHEQVQLKVHLLDRHKPSRDSQSAAGPAGGGLSIFLKAGSTDNENLLLVEKGRWTIPGRLYETEPFALGSTGLCQFAGVLRHAVGDVNTPILQFTCDAHVHPECAGIEVVNAATNELLQRVPPVAAVVRLDSQGGQDVCLRIAGRGEFKAQPVSGVVHLAPLEQTQWPLRKDEQGNLITSRVHLVEREERLGGWAEVDVRTFAGVRRLRFPRFELAYTPAPLRMECAFTDPREALWVGELHRQPLTISAFPVFDRFLEQTVGLFPETLEGTRLRTIDLRSGLTQVTGPENRLLERPQPGGYEGRTVAATYFIESSIPIPPSDKCEIDLTGVVKNLQGAVKTYAVVDPKAKGLFEWVMEQGSSELRQEGGAGTLFCGEPIRFYAEWRPDQNVSAVRFEIVPPSPAEAVFMDMPLAPGTNRTQLEQAVSGLKPGQNLAVYVHVAMRPGTAERTVQVKLRGGEFRTEDRRILVQDLAMGDGTPTDVQGYAWEPVEVPLRVLFGGYKSEDPGHTSAVAQFKKSCMLTVTSRTGQVRDITDRIEWTAVTPQDATRAFRLDGRVTFTPETVGRAVLELKADVPAVSTGAKPSLQRAYAHVLAREPRVAVAVSRLKPGGAEPVFDSRQWVRAEGGVLAVVTRLSTRLRVDVRSNAWAATGQGESWNATVRVLRRSAPETDWAVLSSETGELSPNDPLTREIQIFENGQYALEIVGQDRQSNRTTVHVLTPVIASIQPHEIKPAVPPPAWLTSRVRQWPFEYHVTLYRDAFDLGQLQALAFQFQLPGQKDVWLDGATVLLGPDTPEARQLSAKAPHLLPAVQGLCDGVARFKLSAQGLEVLKWEYPNIRIMAPVLEGLSLSPEPSGPPFDLAGSALASDGSTDLWVRPLFRAAPELQGQWSLSRTTVYLWRSLGGEAAGGPADVRVLERLREQGPSAGTGTDIQAFEVGKEAGREAAKILAGRARWSVWGWPIPATSRQYSLAASVLYRPQEASAGSFGALPVERTIAEWSDLYGVNLDTPWIIPLIWWPITMALLLAVVAAILRVLVPSPSRLALDMRLEEDVAVVEPVRLDNPVLVDLRETSLAQDMQLYARYLCSRWGIAGRHLAQQVSGRSDSRMGVVLAGLLQTAAVVVAPLRVLLRRALYPRRWAWATIMPRVRGNAALVRTALVCVWTGLGARRGRVWSSQAGSFHLPEEGQTRAINLDLPYRIDSVDRTMRVTVRVRRMLAEETRALDTGFRM